MIPRLPALILSLLFIAAGFFSFPAASSDDWSLIKKDKNKNKDKIKDKKGTGKKKITSGKKKKPKDKAQGGGAADAPAGAGVPALFKKLLKDPTDDYLVEKYLEDVQARQAKIEEDIETISAGLPDEKDKAQFGVAAAHACLKAGKIQKASDVLDGLETSGLGGEPSVAYLMGLVKLEVGDGKGAMGFFAKALDHCKGGAGDEALCSRIHDKMAAAALAAGDAKAAADSFVETVKKKGQLEDSFDMILGKLVASEKVDEAQAFILDVLGAFPWSKYEKYYLYATLAGLQSSAGEFKDAMESAEKAMGNYIPSIGDCESTVDLYLGAAGELEVTGEAIASLLGKKPAACVFVRCAQHTEDFAGTKEALSVLQKGLKKFPANEALIVGFAKMLSKTGKVEEATDFLKKQVKKLNSPEVIIEFAKLVMESEGSTKVQQELEKISKSSKQVWIHMALEEYFDSIGAVDMAKKENDTLIALDGKNPEHYIRFGERLFREGKVNEARKEWEKIVQLYPTPFEGKMMLADILFDHGQNNEAGDIYLALLKSKESTITVVKKLAVFYQSTGKIKEAESWWQVVLNSDESGFHEKYEASLRLIQLWKQLGLLKKKEKEVKLLVERNPADAVSKIALAELLFELSDVDKSEKVVGDLFTSGVQDEEVFTAAMSLMEKIWKSKQKPAGLVGKLEGLMEIYPDKKIQVLMKMAQYSAQGADFGLARKCLKQALELKPGDLTLQDKAAELYMKMGDYEEAAACLKLIVAADAYNHARVVDLAEALINTGKEAESVKLLEKVIEQSGDQLLLDRALSLLFTVKHDGKSQALMEPYIYKLYKKSKNERLLKELIEVYALLADQFKAAGGSCKAKAAGGMSAALAPGAADAACGWVARAGVLTSTVIVEGPAGLRLDAARTFQKINNAQMAKSLLQKAAGSAIPAVQILAMAAASEADVSDKEVADIYRAFISEDNKDVKGAALVASSLAGFKEAGENALLFFSDPEPAMRAAAILSAGILLTKVSSETMVQKVKQEVLGVLHERQFNLTYAAAIVVLGQTGGDDTLDSLKNLYERDNAGSGSVLLESKSSDVTRRLILLAMAEGKLEDDRVIPMLVKETWSANPSVAQAAAYGLAVVAQRRTGGLPGSMIKKTIPVTVSMGSGKFLLLDVLEQWSKIPDYEANAAQVQFLAPYLQQVIDGELAPYATQSHAIASNEFDRLFLLVSSMISAGGEMAWEPLSSHVAAGDGAKVQEILKKAYEKKAGAFGHVLDAAYHSGLNSGARLTKPLMALLAVIGGQEAPGIIIAIAGDEPDSPDGLAAIKALGSFTGVGSVEALRNAAQSAGWVTRIAIVESLEKIHSPEACALLEQISGKDASSAVRAMAEEAAAGCSGKL